jgi:hypothetical protein
VGLTVRRVGVTGSRIWDDPAAIREALVLAQGNRPPGEMLLVHGKCPPRSRTKPPAVVRWNYARMLLPETRLNFLGADWLADVIARGLDWKVEQWPARWDLDTRRGGFIRDEAMVAAGADEWLAFVMRCTDLRCARRPPHGSHGAAGTFAMVEKAGMQRRMIKRGW